MASKVPISVENIAFERLNLSRHYLTIDCDFTCFLVLNPSGSVPAEGTDICVLHTGAWQIDAWSLLTKKDFPNIAGFSACLVWDLTLVSETAHAPQCVESDIDTANSVSSLKGQPVNITGFTMPDGSALPVSLVSGTDDGSISVENPLPVRDVRQRYYRFSVGSGYPLSELRGIGASFDRIEGDYDVYLCFPSSFWARISDQNFIASYWGKFIHCAIPVGDSHHRFGVYTPIYSFLSIYRERETGVFSRIAYDGWWASGDSGTNITTHNFDLAELNITNP